MKTATTHVMRIEISVLRRVGRAAALLMLDFSGSGARKKCLIIAVGSEEWMDMMRHEGMHIASKPNVFNDVYRYPRVDNESSSIYGGIY